MAESEDGQIAERYTSISVEASDLQEYRVLLCCAIEGDDKQVKDSLNPKLTATIVVACNELGRSNVLLEVR